MSTFSCRKKLSLRNSQITTAIAVVLLVTQSIFFTWDFKGINSESAHQSTYNRALETLRNVVGDLVDAETGQRGYILTGNETYLEPYTSARNRLRQDLDILASITPPDQSFRIEVRHLKLLADAKIHELDHTVDMRKKSEAAAALAEINLGYGKAVMDEIRTIGNRSMERIRTARDDSKDKWAYRITRASILLVVMAITTVFLVIYGWRSMATEAIETDRLADRLSREAMLDVLTGLPNRRNFEAWANQLLHQAQNHSSSVALILLDLDGFKSVNDTLGHAAGDEVIQEASRRLRSTLRSGELLARLGGDEFAAIVIGDTSRAGLATLADRMIGAMVPRLHPDLADAAVGTSLGIAISSNGRAGLSSLLKAADKALYASKRDGRGRVSFAVDVA